MLRMILKVLLFPGLILLTLFEGVCSIAVNLSGVVFRLIACILIVTGILTAGFGLEPWSEAVRIIMGGVVFLLLPMVAEITVEQNRAMHDGLIYISALPIATMPFFIYDTLN